MGKLDYTNSDLKNKYRGLVRDPSSDLAKITVASNEKRTRAELLDMLEELFEGDDLVFNPTFQDKFKAMVHILVKSIDNTLDDGVAASIATNTAKTGITSGQTSAITANTAKTGITTGQASAISANTAKTGTTSSERSRIAANHAKVSYDKDLSDTSGKAVKMTVTESRGAYALVFTMTHGRVTKSATINLS
tara:strand:+ start:604 stop:1179 length:576 start_codon:yes stop_codon:yes gene_type:complete